MPQRIRQDPWGAKSNGRLMTSVEIIRREASGHAGVPGGGAASRYIANKVSPPPGAWVETRRLRYARRDRSREILRDIDVNAQGFERVSGCELVNLETGELVDVNWAREEDRWARPPRVARCSWALGGQVGIHHAGGDSPAHWSGLERCGSVWSCPVCAGVIRSERAAEIQQAVEAHQAAGGSLLFFTGTLRHHAGDDLAQTLDGILTAWKRTISGAPWRRRKARHGISGIIRSVEVTHGDNGWHPHAHVLLLLDQEMSGPDLLDFRTWLFTRWADQVEALGCKRPTEEGLDLQPVDRHGQVLARYLSKVSGEAPRWGVGAEMARSDVKHGRGSSLAPFELLDMDTAEAWGLWRDYYRATKGRRAVTWSHGLKARFGIGERSDEQIVEETEAAPMVLVADADDYRRVQRTAPALLPRVLESIEAGDLDEAMHVLRACRPDPDQAPPGDAHTSGTIGKHGR